MPKKPQQSHASAAKPKPKALTPGLPARPHRKLVTSLIRAEKARYGFEYQQISERLADYGIRQSATNLSTKVARGVMEAGLFLAIMDVLGVKRIDVPDLMEDLRKPQTP